MEQHERLKQARLQAGFKTGTEAANSLGISVATYNAHENGHRGITLRAAEKYAKKFGVRTAWILTEEHPMHYAKSIEELQTWSDNEAEGASEWGTFLPGKLYKGSGPGAIPEVDFAPPEGTDTAPAREVVGEWTFPTDFVTQVLKGEPMNLFVLQAPDDSMRPALAAGDRAIVDAGQVLYRGDGMYAIADDDGQLHLRQITKLIFNREPGQEVSVATADGGFYVRFDEVKIVGKVIGRIGALSGL